MPKNSSRERIVTRSRSNSLVFLKPDVDFQELKEEMKGPDHAVNETVDYKAADIQKLIKEISNSSEKDQINQHFDMNSVQKI